MPAQVRKGVDKCSGHGGFGARVSDGGSPNVFANGIAVVRVTDHWIDHNDGSNTHDGTSSTGSATVFANGLAKCRVGDSVSCGSTMSEGSPDVFVG